MQEERERYTSGLTLPRGKLVGIFDTFNLES